jgi:sensor histidine kinase YesM
MKRKLSVKNILFHVFFWLGLYLFSCSVNAINTTYGILFWMNNLYYSYFVSIPAAYFVVYYLFPQFLYKKRFPLFVILLVLVFTISIILTRLIYVYIVIPVKWPEAIEKTKFWGFSILDGFSAKFFIIGLLAFVELTRKWVYEQKEKSRLEKEKLENELKFIKSQLSPHFLFNTLNNIDALIYQDQKKASDAVVKLSELLRYVLYDADTREVRLKDEINFVSNLLELQKLRISDKEDIVFKVSGDIDNIYITPMLIIPLIENMFKHGSQKGDSPLFLISITVLEAKIRLYCKNYVREDRNFDNQSGIGLINVKKQLELMYKNNYTFDITQTEKEFIVELVIDKKVNLNKSKL